MIYANYSLICHLTTKSNSNAFENSFKDVFILNRMLLKWTPKETTEEVIKLIIKNCNNFNSIAFNFNRISDELIEEFSLKFGQKLRKIVFISDYESNQNMIELKKLLRLFSYLITSDDKDITHLSLFVDTNKLLVP
jgi:hypothetical protein